MKLDSLLENLDYTLIKGRTDIEIASLISDSRKAAKGCLFVCISGTKSDAHQFVPEVVTAGAAAIVVEKDLRVSGDVTVIRVENARRAWALLSAAWFGYPAREMTTVGITGTKGKTTVSSMICAILREAGKKAGLIGTIGVVIGDEVHQTKNTTPDAYELQQYLRRMADGGCQYVVMEVSSQGLMMDRVAGITFDYGVFTNITPDHIGPGEHKDFEDYLYWKSRLFVSCRHGFFNRDDLRCDEIMKDCTCTVKTFGMQEDCDLKMENLHCLAEGRFMGIAFHTTGERNLDVRVNIPGVYNAYNALAALSVGLALEIPEKAALKALENITINGRTELVYASDEFSVIVDYAHNEVSMESLLEALREYHPARLVCIFGCGGNRSKLRRYGMGEVGGKMADLSIITADNSRWEKVEDILTDIKVGLGKTSGNYLEIPDRREAIHYAIKNARKGDMIVIIGKGHEDYQEIEGIRYPFLDRSVALEALELRK